MNPDACGVKDANGACRNAPHSECQYPLRGKKAGQVCGMKLCRGHEAGDRMRRICPPHERLEAAAAARGTRAA